MTRALRKALPGGAAALLLGMVWLPSGAAASGCLWDTYSWSCTPLPASMASAVRPQPKAGAMLATSYRLTIKGVSR